jgi:hypothetical protein
MPVIYMEKELSWISLMNLNNSHYISNSIIAGDFNIVLHNLEKKGESIVRDPFREKSEDMINEWDLLDIKTIKGKYTWTNKISGPGHIVAKLDRFLVHINLLL